MPGLKPVEFYKNKLILTSVPIIVPEETKDLIRNALKIKYNIDDKFFDAYLAYMDTQKIIFAVKPYNNYDTYYPVDIPIRALINLTKPKIQRLLEVVR